MCIKQTNKQRQREGCYWCSAAVLVKARLRKTTAYTRARNTGVRVTLTRVDRMNTVVLITESSWRRAVRLHQQEPGAAVDAASQSAEETGGCLLASTLEGKYLQDAKQKAS